MSAACFVTTVVPPNTASPVSVQPFTSLYVHVAAESSNIAYIFGEIPPVSEYHQFPAFPKNSGIGRGDSNEFAIVLVYTT